MSRTSDVFSQNKRRSTVGMVQASQSKDDQQSVITLDRLRKFNDIHGTYAGTATDEIAAREMQQRDADFADGEFDQDGHVAQVDDEAAEEQELREEERDEVLSKAMVALSVASKQSKRSQLTSKTYISKLEKQLEIEKQARLKLESEVEEMKKINAEISSKLGLSNASAANNTPAPGNRY